MNYKRHNLDLQILQREAARPRYARRPGWTRVDWTPTPNGGNVVILRGVSLPKTCSAARSDVRIEAPPNLYEPAGADARGNRLYHFYRNIWISPDLRLFDHRTRRWVKMPRLHDVSAGGWAYLCIHPHAVTAGANVLDFIRVMDVFFLNPGYKAAGWEAA